MTIAMTLTTARTVVFVIMLMVMTWRSVGLWRQYAKTRKSNGLVMPVLFDLIVLFGLWVLLQQAAGQR